MSLRLLLLSSMVAVLLAGTLPQMAFCAAPSAGEERGEQSADGKLPDTLRFRRVYVPADRLKDWPYGDVKYMPIEAAKFARLLKTAQTTTPGARALLAARTVTAQYQARLEGDQLTTGQGSLEVIQSAEGQTLLPLDPCGLAIGKANWAGDEPRAATLGSGVDGKLQVRVENSGRLDFEWSLGGHRDLDETVNFQFELPPCPANRLILDVPEGMTPVPDHGVVLQAGRPASIGAGDGLRRWQIELGGHHRFRLRVVPAASDVELRAEQHLQLPLVRESVEYRFSLRGLDLSAELRFEVHNEPLEQVTLALDPELQLVTARYGDMPVSWSVTSASGSPVTRIVLTLPEPVQNTGGVLWLRALAPLAADRRWRLPRIRPEEVFWEEGKAILIVPAPLLLKRLVPIGCRQSDAGPLSAPGVGESAEFQYFAPDATVEVVLSQQQAPVQLASGTAIQLGDREMTAQVRADFRISGLGGRWGESRFLLEADVSRQWLIDSVESFPPEAMDDWDLGKPSGRKRKLTVRLAKALSPARPILLEIHARRPHPPLGRKLGIDDLVPLRFRGPADSKRLVTVDVAGPYQLKLTGGEQLNRINSWSLDGAELELFAERPHALLFENDPGAAELRIVLESKKPSYSGRLQVKATVGGDTLQESYALRCVPESSRVDRLLVYFSHRRDVPLDWTLGGEDGQQLSARQLSIDEQAAAGLSLGEDAWELTLRPPRSETFEISGAREIELAEAQPISLAALPEATSQRAMLTIHSPGSQSVRIKNNRLTPVPAETIPPDRYQTARATYRYDPLRDVVGRPDAAVTVSPSPDLVTPSAWVWNCHLESWYEANGAARHLATYRLQNSGRGRVWLPLPPAEGLQEVDRVWVDQNRVVWERLADQPSVGARLAVDLPPGEKFPTVSVQFTTPRRRLGIVGSLEPPLPQANLPQADVPILSWHWTVWLPPGYEAFDPDLRRQPRRGLRPTWSQRLFGPLGRAAGEVAFDPLNPRHWFPAVSDRSARRLGKRDAERLLQTLGELTAGGGVVREDGGLDWAGLLGHPSTDALQLPLLVDRHAMAHLALAPQTPVRPGSGDTPSARGLSLLQKANLSLLVHSEAILLTSQANAALNHAYLAPLGHQTLWWVLPGPLAERLRQAAAGEPNHLLVPVETWTEQPAEPKVLWTLAGRAGRQPADTQGWTACRLETSGTAPARLKFVHRQTMRMFGSVAFLLVIALGWWTAGDRPVCSRQTGLLTWLVGVFGFAALVVPEAYIPIASGAVLGTLFCLAYRLIGRRNTSDGLPGESGRKPARPRAASVTILLGVVVFVSAASSALCAAANGQQPEPKSPPTAPPVHRVFIPIDEKQQPTGGKYNVPLEFYKQLHPRAQGWLITAATYRGVLSRKATSERLAVDQLKADFALQVFEPMTRVRIPLHREEANLLPDGALLDSRVIQPEWEPDGSGLLFEVPQPGEYRLELSLRPTMRIASLHGSSATAGFDLTIPRLATSRLELTVPPGAPPIEVPSAMGQVCRGHTGRFEEEPPRLTANLGPSDRLAVRWPDGAGRGGAGLFSRRTLALDVEELLWLKVRDGSVVVDAKFKFKIIAGQVRQLQLAADPRLRLDRLQIDDLPVDEPHTAQSAVGTLGQPQIITVPLPAPHHEAVVVDASFFLRETMGVGNLRLPKVKALDARPTRRWLAVSVDRALKHEEPASDQLEALAVSDFLRGWGQAETQPSFAYRLAGTDRRLVGETAWSMSTRPREPHTTVEQRLVLSFGRGGSEVHFDAKLLTTAGSNFQYRITAPPGLQIEHVSLLEEGVERAARSAQDTDGTITVFLTGPVAGRQELSLRSRMPTRAEKKMPLPVLRIEGSNLQSSSVELFRHPSVRVEVGRTNGLVEVDDPVVDSSHAELGRLVGRFRAEGEKPIGATLTLVPNRPKVRAEQVTRLRCDGGIWNAQLDCRIHASDGVVDEIRIGAPNPWNGPYQIQADPPATLKVLDAPGKNRQLIVQPSAPIDAEYQFSISGPLAFKPGDRPSAPRIALQQVGKVKQFLALPEQAEGQPIEWKRRGLKEAELPAGFLAPAEAGSLVTYKVAAEAFQATVRPPDRTRENAHVRLADVQIAWQADGTCRGVATFDLEPGKSPECPLWLPSGYDLVQVLVAEVPTVPVSNGENRWRLPLGPARLPQRIEVVFTGILPGPASATGRRFDAPTLGELPVGQTLWTVAGPSLFEPGEPEDSRLIGPGSHELFRLRSAAALIKSVSMVPPEDPGETRRWYRRWARRLAAARRALGRRLARTGTSEHTRDLKTEVEKIDREQSRIAERLGTADELAQQFAAAAPVADNPAELWRRPLDPQRAVTRCTISEGAGSLTLSYRRAEADGLPHRLARATGLSMLIALVVLGLRRGTLAEWFKRWPYAIGVAAGLAWWLWVSPSILGWGIVLVSLIASLLFGWKHSPETP